VDSAFSGMKKLNGVGRQGQRRREHRGESWPKFVVTQVGIRAIFVIRVLIGVRSYFKINWTPHLWRGMI
jgi:hypothetical protein